MRSSLLTAHCAHCSLFTGLGLCDKRAAAAACSVPLFASRYLRRALGTPLGARVHLWPLLCAQEAETPAADQKADAQPAEAEDGATKAAEPAAPAANPPATTEQSVPAAE